MNSNERENNLKQVACTASELKLEVTAVAAQTARCRSKVKSTIHTVYSTFITVRRYALHGLGYRNSVPDCPSVCPSVTLVDCVHMV